MENNPTTAGTSTATTVDTGTNDENISINSYTARIQVPQLNGYSIQNIESWFTRLDAYFKLNSFGKMNQDQRDLTKFNIAVMYMDERLHEQAYEVIRSPPLLNRYTTLRDTIISKFSASPMVRLEQLTSGIQLGDNKPSHMLCQLQRTEATNDQQLIKEFWVQRLPISARAVITGVAKSNPEMPINKLASIADEVMEAMRANGSSICSTSTTNKIPQKVVESITESSLETRVKKIEQNLTRISNQLNNNRFSRSKERSARSVTPHNTNKRIGENICWYHKKFDDKAENVSHLAVIIKKTREVDDIPKCRQHQPNNNNISI